MMRQPVSTGKRRNSAFTLIELLVTLSIMAIMAAMLFPFIQNYQYRAKTSSTFASLKTMQDAMGRFIQMADDFDPNTWGGSVAIAGPWTYFTNATTTNQVTYCAKIGDAYGNQIISDITTAGSNQSLKLTKELEQPDYVLFYRSGPITNMNFFPVFYNIDEPNDSPSGSYAAKNDYIDFHGNRVSNAKRSGFPTDANYIIGLFQ